MVIKESLGDRVFNYINLFFMTLILIIVMYPLYFVVIASFSNPGLVNSGKVLFVPKGISLDGYQMVFNHKAVWVGYRNSLLYTATSTLIHLTVTLTAAFVLCHENLRFKNFITMIFVIPMFFGGGLIPYFLLVTKTLNLGNTLWALVLPGATSMMSIVIARTFMTSTIPKDLHESAEIDGANKFRVFFSIILPLSGALIAVLGLFAAVGQWNSYFNAMLFITDQDKWPLQMVLRRILVESQARAVMAEFVEDLTSFGENQRRVEQIKYALIIVSVIPVLLIYPFVQRYFVKGVMIGAIKG